MEKLNYNILSIFPQPLLQTVLPSNLSKIISFFNSQETNKDTIDTIHIKNYGSRSKNSYILNHPKCKFISKYILSLAKDFGTQVLNHDYSEYKFSQSWISIKNPGESHAPHFHANSLISGVFYYGKILDNTPSIGFKPNTLPMHIQPLYKENIDPFLSDFYLKPKPGTLYMFPSHYVHFVPENKTTLPRKSVAFNIVPVGGFGDEHSLTELKF